AKYGGDALVHLVEIAVRDRIAPARGKERLQPALHRVLVERLRIALVETGRKYHAPEAPAVVARDLEQGAPFVRIGAIVARAAPEVRAEIERRREHQEALRMGIAFERDAERLAHRRTSAIGADQIRSGEPPRPRGALDPDLDPVVELLERHDAGREL